MWNDLSPIWQNVFMQGWEAFKNGSLPIGAVIVDENDNIISVGRNQTGEKIVPNPKTAHAETMCIRNLDVAKYPDVKQYTLFTSLEPCPMCMGTMVMGLMRKLRVAAKDSYCGAIRHTWLDPYIKDKNIDVALIGGEMQDVQYVEQCYFYLREFGGETNYLVEGFRKDSPKAVEVAERLYEEKYLDKCVTDNVDYRVVYDYIVSLMEIS